MPTRTAPDKRAMMHALAKAFVRKVQETYPQAPLGVGWQRALARDLERDASVSLKQSMISKITTFLDISAADKTVEIDTIVKVRNYTGMSLEALLGLDGTPSSPPPDIERRLSELEALIRSKK